MRRTMIVKLLSTFACPERGCKHPGESLDVGDPEARALIAGGYAQVLHELDALRLAAEDAREAEEEETEARPRKGARKVLA